MKEKEMREVLVRLWGKVFRKAIELKELVNDRYDSIDAYQSTELAPRLDKIDSDLKSLTTEIQELRILINDLI